MNNYYSGGIAEFVQNPSDLTFSYLSRWMTGRGSLGLAMKLLHLPYTQIDLPLLIRVNNETFVNLDAEASTLYRETLFTYKQSKHNDDTPALRIQWKNIYKPRCIANTLRMILVQSDWIANSKKYSSQLRKLLDSIDDTVTDSERDSIDKKIETVVLPVVLAIGYVSEFIAQFLQKEYKENFPQIQEQISDAAYEKDWYFRSIADMQLVQTSQMTFEKYMELYGLRADSDYELESPRWREIPDIIRARISSYTPPRPPKTDEKKSLHHSPLMDFAIDLTILRSDAKRKLLVYINALRIAIDKTSEGPQKISAQPDASSQRVSASSGKGTPVSRGEVTGIALQIPNTGIVIPQNTIGIFPNASPTFSIIYPKCSGLIFLRGGQTSHGAIVAREFGIPALIDRNTESVKSGSEMTINGSSGEWTLT